MNKIRSIGVTFKSGNLTLEGCLEFADNSTPCPAVVLCHPHPLYGGNMENNVIMAVSQALTAKGIAAFRFNFRGVCRSQGSFAGGIGEQEDARAALSFLVEREEVMPGQIGIMGYSFGGMIAFSVGTSSNLVKAIAGVSPVMSPDILKESTKPKLIVIGTEDLLVPLSAILQEQANMSEPKTVKAVPGADHFWYGHEETVADIVASFFLEVLI